MDERYLNINADGAPSRPIEPQYSRRLKWKTICISHSFLLFFLLAGVLFLACFLAFIEPITSLHSDWHVVQSGCTVVEAKMTFIQGVVGNTDLIGSAWLKYTDPGTGSPSRDITAVLSRRMATIASKELEAAFITDMLANKANNTVLKCWTDNKNPYRVSLNPKEDVDGFIGFVTFIVVVICLIECAVVLWLWRRRAFYSDHGGLDFCCCFWILPSRRSFLKRESGASYEFVC